MARRSKVSCIAVLIAVGVAIGGTESGRADGAGWDDHDLIEVATGNAYRGPWRMNESDFDYVDDPAPAIADDGHVGVAWVDQARQTVYFQMYAPDGEPRFTDPVDVSRSPDVFSWLPRVVIPPGDAERVYVLWQEIVFSGGTHGGEIHFARSTDGGRTFDTPINLSETEAGAGKGRLTARRWDNGSLDLAYGPEGQLYAAWTEYEGRLWISHSTDGGESFTAPLHVAGNENRPARAPALAVGRAGTVHLGWTVGEDAAADIHLAASTDGGRSFGEPYLVGAGDGHADAPKIAADSENRLHIVYGESPDGPLRQYHLRYARQEASGGRISEPRAIVRPQPPIDSVNFPNLAVDAADRLYLAWELFPRRDHFPRGLGFTVSLDGGESFAPASIVPGSDDPDLGVNGSLQGSLMDKLAVGTDGTVVLVNSSYTSDRASRIQLWRIPPPPP